jgi:Na+/alanine symporter
MSPNMAGRFSHIMIITRRLSHPVKQGLAQAFSAYVDTLFVCTMTGLMILSTKREQRGEGEQEHGDRHERRAEGRQHGVDRDLHPGRALLHAQASAAAHVSHPVKQGLAQAFSAYVDTLFVCTMTSRERRTHWRR